MYYILPLTYTLCPFPCIVHSHNLISPANASPNITVDKIFNVTVGQETTLTVTTFDADGDTVTVTENTNGPKDASFTGGEYKWKPTNMDPVNISYVLYASCHI